MSSKQIATDLQDLANEIRCARECCCGEYDRMFRASDQSWWKRVGNEWLPADPPNGWVKKESNG